METFFCRFKNYYLANVGEDTWNRTVDGVMSDSWKNGPQGNFESRAVGNRQITTTTATAATSQLAHSIGPWQDPKMLNVLGQTTQSSSV